MRMAEAELHRERLQAIAEKRKRQAAIEDKRQQLEDQILQLQHLKSKSLREKWLMQGAPAGSVEEEEARKRQCEEDEHKLKILEENVQRLERDIEQLESEESLISAKEQILREKLKETEVSFVDLQKSFSNQDKDTVNYIYSQIPDLTNLYSHQESSLICDGTTKVPGSKKKIVQFKDVEEPEEQGTSSAQLTRTPIPEDDIKLKKDKEHISANHSKPIDIILTNSNTMEFEVSESKGVTVVSPDVLDDNQLSHFPTAASHNGLKDRHESLDSDVAKEIQYLDEVLEANCCDTAADNPFNGSTSPEPSIMVDGSGPFVSVTNDFCTPEMDIIAIERKPLPVVEMDKSTESMEPIKINGHSKEELKDDHIDVFTYPTSPNSSNSSRRSSKDGETIPKVIKKEAKFELRAFNEEKKPSKLFEDFNEKEHIRVRKVRPSEEVVELEKERIELIKSQAVKKNPGIATKWWNPPQEKTLEEQLDSEHLESHLKYKERKQKQQHTVSFPPIKSVPVSPVPSEPSSVKKEDIVTEQIDFSAARKQFLNMESTSQPSFRAPPKRSVTPSLFTVKPFYKVSHDYKSLSSVTVTNPFNEFIHSDKPDDVSLVNSEKAQCSSEDQQWTLDQTSLQKTSTEHLSKILAEDNEFVSPAAKQTAVKDDDADNSDRFMKSVSSIPEELDSGLDDLSVKSQDTTVMETLSNDFSMDNISDSGASNETINTLNEHSLGEFSQPQTPLNENDYTVEGVSKSFSDQGFYSPSSMLHDSIASEDPIEYQAGVLVQNVIQQALAEKAGISDYSIQENPAMPEFDPKEDFIDQMVIVTDNPRPFTPESQDETVFEPPQVSSPVPETRGVTVTPKTVEAAPQTRQHKVPEPLSIPPVMDEEPIEEPIQESYFSKYSQAAELRSTALATQEPEITVGPFKLRSKKQKTLSMIEEEIRAAQEREQELKRQRQRQSLQSPTSKVQQSLQSPTSKVQQSLQSPTSKVQQVQQSLQSPTSPTSKNVPIMPTRTASYKTAPGKIEKVRTSSTSKADSLPLQDDILLEDPTASQRPKNLMQTLMDDFESHKSKRRDRMDDSTVLEAVRVGRRKSAQALRWEAGIYANREEDE